MPDSMPVSDLTDEHTGRWVTFARPTSDLGPPRVKGVLRSAVAVQDVRNNVPRVAYSINVERPTRFMGMERTTYGPVPANFPISVHGKYRPRVEMVEQPRPPFPNKVRRVRVLLIGEPFDSLWDDLSVEEFGYNTNIRVTTADDNPIRLTYAALGELKQIKGALWGGIWCLASGESQGPDGGYKLARYNAPPRLSLLFPAELREHHPLSSNRGLRRADSANGWTT